MKQFIIFILLALVPCFSQGLNTFHKKGKILNNVQYVNNIEIISDRSIFYVKLYCVLFFEEGRPYCPELNNLLRKRLISTGVFSRVDIVANPSTISNFIDLKIYVEYKPDFEKLKIRKIILKGFKKSENIPALIEELKNIGISSGTEFSKTSPREIIWKLQEAYDKVHGKYSSPGELSLFVSYHLNLNNNLIITIIKDKNYYSSQIPKKFRSCV